jgi:hypothetical protein
VCRIAGRAPTERPIDEGKSRENLMGAVLRKLSNPSQFVCGLEIAGTQVLAANGAQESSPIVPVAPSYVDRRQEPEGAHRFICRGIDEIFKRMCAEERLSDAAFPWMAIGDRFSLAGYREFKGGRTGCHPPGCHRTCG